MIAASPHLIALMIRQNEETLAGLRRLPPADTDGAAGRAHRMTVDQLREQTLGLNERLQQWQRNPPAPRKRKSFLDIDPRPTGAFSEPSEPQA